MRAAVVGVGVAGSSHLFDLVSSPDFDVVAVCASRMKTAEKAASLFGIPAACNDIGDLLDAHRPEAVVIATPPRATPDILGRCLRSGAWVIVDKPAASDAPGLRHVIASVGPLANRARVAYNRRYQQHVMHARDLIAHGGVGPLTGAECHWSGPFTSRYTSPGTYRRSAGPGHGVLLDTGCHIIDALAMLTLAPLTVRGARLTTLPGGTDIAAEVRLAFGPGEVPIAMSIRDGGEDTWRITIRGQEGYLELDPRALSGECCGDAFREMALSGPRPVDDLLRMRDGQPASGATLAEAAETLDTLDRARGAAGTPVRPWRKPRAKALGRLNGAC